MGFPAGRVGDIWAMHADVCAMGSPNVIVNNKPFHRVTDLFICPFIGIGITLSGSGTVLINGKPAARATSAGVCWTPNILATGSPNVIVGG